MFSAVPQSAARDLVVGRLAGLPQIRRVSVRNRDLVPHTVQGSAGIETAGKRDADLLDGGKTLENVRHNSAWGKELCQHAFIVIRVDELVVETVSAASDPDRHSGLRLPANAGE